MNNISVAEVLKEWYAITDCQIEPDTKGSGTNYWIDDKYLLKVFANNVKYRLEDEIAVCDFLRSRGVPTSEHVLSRDGHYIQQIGEYRYHLQKKIPGVAHEGNSLCFDECSLLLRRLKQIVELLSEFPSETKVNMLFSHEYVKADIIGAISMRCCNTVPDLLSILERKKELINRIRFQNGLVQHVILSHSDYNIQQVLTTDNKLRTLADMIVIDFSHVSKVPIEWEIIKTCLRSMHFEKESCIQAILYSFSMFESVVPMTYNNICIAIMQLISSSYMEKLYINTHNQEWLDRINYDLDVLETVYESVR